MLNRLIEIGEDEIQLFRTSGQSSIIPFEVQRYILHIERAAELFPRIQNVTIIAKRLMSEFPSDKMALITARTRVYDSINYFHLNNSVRNEAWDNYYAFEMYPKLFLLALKKQDIDLAFKIQSKIHETLTKRDKSQFGIEELNMRPILINPDIPLERLGIQAKDLREIWRNASTMFDKLGLEDADKTRLKLELSRELNIEEEFNKIVDDGN